MDTMCNVPQHMTFSISHRPHAYETYTVRTSGVNDDGWTVVQVPGVESFGAAGRTQAGRPFRLLMCKGTEWIWRRVETIWPSRLTEAEIDDWRAKFLICLEENDHQRMIKAIYTARFNGQPTAALYAEWDAAVEAEVRADMKLHDAGKTPPFRSPHGTSFEEVEALRRRR